MAARFRLAKFNVAIAEKAFDAGGVPYPAGSWILPAQDGLKAALDAVASELSLDFDSAPRAPGAPRHDAPIPRLAVWHTWADTESVGWVRYTLDQEAIPYTYIRDEEIRAGGLRSKFDIILYGNNYLDLKAQIHGIEPRFGPMPYTRTADYPSHGVPDASDDITGGIGWAGMASLQTFLDEGGLFIALGNGSALPLEGGLVRRVTRRDTEVVTPGVELTAKFSRPDHPLAYGYPGVTSVFREQYPVYALRPADRRYMVLQWGTRPVKDERDERDERGEDDGASGRRDPDKGSGSDSMVVSGGAKRLDDLEGLPAIVDLPAPGGRGRVLAFNFNPMHRDLNHSDFRLVWNGILNWSALPPAAR
jgi:hypothetical protein